MAISNATVWEVRNGGSDTACSGGFVAGASGTDYSQQAAAQYNNTDLASTSGATNPSVVTSASHSFVAADVGNIIRVTAGTNWTAGFYQIVSVSGGAATLDRNVGTAATLSAGSYCVGGAFATPGQGGAAMIASNTLYIKYSVTAYTCSATSNVAGGRVTNSGGGFVIGYDMTRTLDNTDANMPTLQPSANSVTVLTNTNGSGGTVRNLKVANPSAFTSCTGFNYSASTVLIERCTADSLTIGFSSSTTASDVHNCLASNCTTGFQVGIAYGCVALSCATGFSTSGGGVCVDCLAINGAGTGFASSTNTLSVYINCTAYGRTGATGYGFGSSAYDRLINCVSYGNSQFGYNVTTSTTGKLINCAGGNNTAGNTASGWRSDQLTGFITLTADPFTSAAGNDFSPNNTAGGGALLRAAGWPATFPGLSTTSRLDVGAVQHQDSGGSARNSGILTGGRL
jgi:hypothetical protein